MSKSEMEYYRNILSNLGPKMQKNTFRFKDLDSADEFMKSKGYKVRIGMTYYNYNNYSDVLKLKRNNGIYSITISEII